jgi:ADP-ribosyl-[dinitrogen reductase] hydrolase
MIGAIVGDIVGSRFEFNNCRKTNFKLFTRDSRFTDDTVCTMAVIDWIVNVDEWENQN